MSSSNPAGARQICEDLLAEDKRYNIEKNILPGENAITDRLLSRGEELEDAYAELHDKLHLHPHALATFLSMVLTTAAFWNPEEIAEARAARNNLIDVNRQIARQAAELATLIQRRSELANTSGFHSETHYHVCQVIEEACEHNYHFQSYVQKPLKALRTRFDLKYWPDISEFLQVLSDDAQRASPIASDPLTAVSTAASRSSLSDFAKAFLTAIEEQCDGLSWLPRDLSISDSTLASLVNCMLDLGPDEIVGSDYIKGVRQRMRGDLKKRLVN